MTKFFMCVFVLFIVMFVGLYSAYVAVYGWNHFVVCLNPMIPKLDNFVAVAGTTCTLSLWKKSSKTININDIEEVVNSIVESIMKPTIVWFFLWVLAWYFNM